MSHPPCYSQWVVGSKKLAGMTIDESSPSKTIRGNQRRPGPVLVSAYFAFIVCSGSLTAYLLGRLGLGRFEPAIVEAGIYSPFVFLPLSYAFYPEVFSPQYWRFPKNIWKWLTIPTVLQAIILIVPPGQNALTTAQAISMIAFAPILEEIIRAVMISALIQRWGPLWTIVFVSILTALVHPSPALALAQQFALSIIFVKTNKSIPGAVLAHLIINVMAVLAGGISHGSVART